MFALLNSGSAKCLVAYKDIQQGAIVPPVNELWAQVEEWVAENGWADYVEPEYGKSDEEIAQIEHAWVISELGKIQIELMYHWTDDKRSTHTLDAWNQYARELRDYTTTDEDGVPSVVGDERPVKPI
ncbi:hypothetical protein [Vibrio metoecus]|uniref:hypothetical protein n=1 Tax=Vibrio metoecus TaxID=1481663 RepID=UPI001F2FA4B1|nr:hypothetical protein [Vibrio metoecus]